MAVATLVLAVAEAGARLHPAPSAAAVAPAGALGEILMNGNPWLLWELMPGRHEEKGAVITVNSAGFRDAERGPKSRPRALAIGDSSVYGFGVHDNEVFTSLLEARIPADFINVAVPGYSTFQSLNQLRARGLSLKPDLLLVASLWSDNNFDSFSDKDLLASYAGWTASAQGRIRAWLQGSAIFQRLDWQWRVKPAAENAKKVGWQVGGDDPRSGNRRVALSDYLANLDAFCAVMAECGGGVVFVTLANREDIAAVSMQPAWGPYRDAMVAAAARCHAPLVDIVAPFRASGRSADALFLDQMHPTPEGHALMADTLAAALAAWPETPIRAVPTRTPPVAPADPFEGHGVERTDAARTATSFTLHGTLRAPQWQRGNILLDVSRPGDAGPALGSVSIAGPGAFQLKLSEPISEATFHAYLDVAADGPTGGDRQAAVGPIAVPPDGKIELDLTTAQFVDPAANR